MTAKKESRGCKVVNYTDHLAEARDILKEKGEYNGMKDPWSVAMALLFEKNTIMEGGNVVKGGQQYFVVKA